MGRPSVPGERPVPGPPTIGVDGELDVLRDLLQIERERLTVALRIEAERKIVFPETTVIARDVERLLEKVVKREREEANTGQRPVPVADRGDLEQLLSSLNLEVS